ncbi:MAG: aminotransferase class IV [Planctomycetaceae bacterium]
MKQISWWNGQTVTDAELSVNVFDLGFVLGVTVSEQLRTFGGRLFHPDEHLQRLKRSLQIIGVHNVDLQNLREQAMHIASHNHALLSPGDDLGLTIIVTPGRHGVSDGGDCVPTVGIYTTPLPFHRWADLYESGETLVVSTIRQVPGNCWPEELKCRSRMHYYLADREARQKKSGARALLLDQDGFMAEASTAGVLLYRADEGIVAPRADKVLPSISVGVIRQLAAEQNIDFVHRDIRPDEVVSADEVFLTSTSPCILPVVSVDGNSIGDGTPGRVYRRILSAWSNYVQVDIARQARQFATRQPSAM